MGLLCRSYETFSEYGAGQRLILQGNRLIIPYLNEDSSEGECVKYIQTVIQNRYKSLCRCNLSAPETDDIDSSTAILTAPDTFDDSYYDIAAFIASLPEKSIKQEIMTLFFVN